MSKDNNYYFVDFKRKPLIITYDSRADVMHDVKFFKLKSAMDLNSPDLKVFETFDDAEKFLESYKTTLKNLDNAKICKSRKLPAMLYKRKYLVQSLLGLKNFTVRSYLKPWKPGDMINLHDQTYFLSVKLTDIKTRADGNYEYHFKLP